MHARSDASHIVVFTTLATAEDARTLVRHLVEERVVACGTLLEAVTSVYRWQGAIEEVTETQVILKTRRARWDDLQDAVRDLHPYDVPELVAMRVETGLPAYLAWITEATAAAGEEPE